MKRFPPQNPGKARRQLLRLFYRWHRRVGVATAIFLVWIVISGWLLNHSDSLNLAQHQIHSSALANWYNLRYELPTNVLSSKNHWFVEGILDGKKLSVPLSKPIGIVETEHLVVIASPREMVLLDSHGGLIDKLDSSSLPLKNITQIGEGCAGIAITNNNEIVATNDGLEWHPCVATIAWSTQQPITREQLSQIEPLLLPDISLEKIMVDLHTGRFFGVYGAYVVDVVGLCLLLLALSGCWLFLRSAGKR